MKRVVIIGGGVSGMALAYRLGRNHGVNAIVLEADTRPGGKARTVTADGFTCEEATNGWLDKEASMRDLIRDLGLEARVQPSNDAASRRFIYRAGRLRELHLHPLKFLTSSALPLVARLRVCLEPFVKQRTDAGDETLASFASRRLGRGARDLLIGPMASGVYAGDPDQMSLRSCFAKVHALEVNHGGLIKGMVALKKEKKRVGENPSEVQAGPSGRLTSLKGGIGDLTGALADTLGDRLELDARVTAVRRVADGGFELDTDGHGTLAADAVVSAAPAHAATRFLASLDEDAAAALAEIPYPPLFVVCLGFDRAAVAHDLNGFGFLVPRRQDKTVLGTLFTSTIFPGRAPDGSVLIRSMIGGMLEPQVAAWSEDRVLQTVQDDIAPLLGISPGAEPTFVRIFRHDRAIPQYHVGHAALLHRVAEAEQRNPGFFATGNALKGIGVIDCVRESVPLAARIAEALKTH